MRGVAKIIAIYARQSKDEDNKNIETINTQISLLKDYASAHFKALYREYVDDNVSGVTFERKGLQQLKDDISKGLIDILLVKDLSRLGRNNAKTLLFLDYLEENNVRLITIDGRYDSQKDNDTVGIDTWYNERYAKDISKKIRANINFKIRNGEYIGTAPFGYKKSTVYKNKLEIKEDEAKVVREIFSLYKQEYGYKKISQLINEKYEHRGYNFNPIKVKRILQNRVYIGETIQGVSKKVSYKSKKTVRLPEDKWVVTKNTHTPIISDEDFLEVWRIRSKKGNNYGGNKGTISMFRGLIFCGDCKSSMNYVKNGGRSSYYICSNYMKNGKKACSRHAIKEEVLIREIKMEIEKLVCDKESLKEAMKIYKQEKNSTRGEVDIVNVTKKIHKLKNKQQLLYMDRLNMDISLEIFNKVNKEIECEIKDLEKQANDYMKVVNSNHKNSQDDICDIIKRIKNMEITRKLILIMVDKITVYQNPDKVYIEFNLEKGF